MFRGTVEDAREVTSHGVLHQRDAEVGGKPSVFACGRREIAGCVASQEVAALLAAASGMAVFGAAMPRG
jgi:hypothetical protein